MEEVMKLMTKARRVYNSCKTLEQLVMAEQYAKLTLKVIKRRVQPMFYHRYEQGLELLHKYKQRTVRRLL